ncbi:hypothetical protein B0T25DRAFT_613574 [Lasiosphaeria hispida]|uniref:ubiquitinyl hydrolase 1 n=1 Tax=Lasiosphaeria hispida TaxID=260671 RepID=A0AAJ0HC73_9PEZI|nr:hypothetical protein B0T25DRAFT_613574 [Lasiosphaeria hispida]
MNDPKTRRWPAGCLEYTINHVFMPPRLPQEDDTQITNEHRLIASLLESVRHFTTIEPSSVEALLPVIGMLEKLLGMAPGRDCLNKERYMRDAISTLKEGDSTLFHLRAQNAGLLITARQDDVLFEAFELLAQNYKVMSTRGSLVREFPDCAAVVKRSLLADQDFLDNFIQALRELELEKTPAACPVSRKAGTNQVETRDTVSPFLVTGLLMDVLSGLGLSVTPQTISKRSREQVNWDNSLLPFHRSPTWLLLRVALRLVLDFQSRQGESQPWYKPVLALYHSDLLKKATSLETRSDLLFTMRAKLVRRVLKIESVDSQPWLKEVEAVVESNKTQLEKRWLEYQEKDAQVLSFDKLQNLSFTADSMLKLKNLELHISWIKSRSPAPRGAASPGDITMFDRLSTTDLPSLFVATLTSAGTMGRFVLLDFESWIENCLPSWLRQQLRIPRTSSYIESSLEELESLVCVYYAKAKNIYHQNPEALSVMYLVIMELWVVMDKIAGHAVPLLLEYNPGFPRGLLNPLLLDTAKQMSRLQNAEAYLYNRNNQSNRTGYPSAFSEFGSSDSLAVRYFNNSPEHQALLETIEETASRDKQSKLEEYEAMKQKYHSLSRQHDLVQHKEMFSRRTGEYSHDYSHCQKCSLDSQRRALEIRVFEWPLPSNSDEAKAAVFEISLPRVVEVWRSVTLKLFRDIFREEKLQPGSGKKTRYYAAAFSGLKRFAHRTDNVLQPASTLKPMAVSHYAVMSISDAREDEVCAQHAAQYTYHDAITDLEVDQVTRGSCVPSSCSYIKIADAPKSLSHWIPSTAHTSNQVIAAQSNCPLDMTLSEFRAFGNLRSGARLQWANVLCQLKIPSLDLNKKSSFSLILQACLEAGPDTLNTVLRDTHVDTESEQFAENMVEALYDAFNRVRESWQNDVAVCLLVCLATRLLSLSPSEAISGSLLGYLSRIRKVSIGWARQLVKKIDQSNVAHDHDTWTQRLLRTSLICASTFDVGTGHLKPVLSSPTELSILVEASILARDHFPPNWRPSDSLSLLLSHRWHKVMYQSQEIIEKSVVEQGNSGLDTAIRAFWADYTPSTCGWQAQEGDQGHVLKSSVQVKGSDSLSIEFNILTGNLFVNGCSLSKLPSDYQDDPTFTRLFGTQALDVMPSTMHGMRFSARHDHMGWVVHLAMIDGRLVIQSTRNSSTDSGPLAAAESYGSPSSETWEYIPPESFGEDLSASFLLGYAHWINITTDVVEFRPVNQPWAPSPDTWTLAWGESPKLLRRGNSRVVDPHSSTSLKIHKILKPLESAQHGVDLIFHTDSRVVQVDLPKFAISFTLKEGEAAIRSKDYTGMRIDEAQGIKTLVGLQNKLVLRPEGEVLATSRMVIIPRGELSSNLVNNHVRVAISHPKLGYTRHDAFRVDTKLGCLTDSGSLPKEALRILRSASIRSFPFLGAESRGLLEEIARISPTRVFYPDHLKDMEQVAWSGDLSPLSQDDDFRLVATSILKHYLESETLFPGDQRDFPPTETVLRQSNGLLVERARLKNAIFRVSEYGAEAHTDSVNLDASYSSNDRNSILPPSNIRHVRKMVKCINSGRQQLVTQPAMHLKQLILSSLTGGSEIDGSPKVVDLRFNLENLELCPKKMLKSWCGLHVTLAAEPSKYRCMFFLSSLLYAQNSNWEVIQTLMAFTCMSETFKSRIIPPLEHSFDLKTTRESLYSILERPIREMQYLCPDDFLSQNSRESARDFASRQTKTWNSNSARAINLFMSELRTQYCQNWAVSTPNQETYSKYMDVGLAMSIVRETVDMARRSDLFDNYLDQIITRLRQAPVMGEPGNCSGDSTPCTPRKKPGPHKKGFIDALSLFSQPPPTTIRPEPELFAKFCVEVKATKQDHVQLSRLQEELSSQVSLQPHQQSYVEELHLSSSSAAGHRSCLRKDIDLSALQLELDGNLAQCRREANAIFEAIKQALKSDSLTHQLCGSAGLYPRISPLFLLERMTRAFWQQLPGKWQHCLVNYALCLSYLQRAERLVTCGPSNSKSPGLLSDLQKELVNAGNHNCSDWDPIRYPETVLLEVEQGLLIRPIQYQIAAVMKDPPNKENAVMQLNMGEGKSSVIVPIVAAALADGERLVRVVVAKPQSHQMMHTLISKLSGLINRRIFYLPVSRSVQLTSNTVAIVRRIVDACKRDGGVLLMQPEHILSFKLMGIEKIWSGEDIGQEVLELYQGFENDSRDIVDESDENFSVKFELVYTMGTQQPVDMSPDRWVLIQEIMAIVRDEARDMKAGLVPRDNSSSEGLLFEELPESAQFPTIRVLEEAAGRQLVGRIAERVCSLGLKGFPVSRQTPNMRQAVLNYILTEDVPEKDIALVEDEDPSTRFFSEAGTKSTLLLLRGLLAKGVILFVLGQKRFRVNYGLAHDRRPPTKLAVPYRAKDMPSPRSEFSHPEVVIMLTCLSYYYRGLSDAELYTCLEMLNSSEQGAMEYGIWSAAAPDLPDSFRHFSSINLKDRPQCEKRVFPALRLVKPAIDFYLSCVVFAKEIKEFPSKLSASGWDLAKPKAHPLTGFSGTIDAKNVLPISVQALDLPEQRHTNAAVLSCLLRDENTVLCIGNERSRPSALTVDMLLHAVTASNFPMRVILDVGAQIIDCSNIQMAQRWLDKVPGADADAVIFFNDQDELSVLARDGRISSFMTSPFATQTGRCLVFLDQAHTRGTDLRLPDSYRAAVTLGPGITKDTLAQACMRMRKLGHGQAVTFCVSPEMQKRIRDLRNMDRSDPLAVKDILFWAISETWNDTARSVPLWAMQGMRHQGQEAMWAEAEGTGTFSKENASDYLEKESMTLEERYRPKRPEIRETDTNNRLSSAQKALDSVPPLLARHRQKQVDLIQQKIQAFELSNTQLTSNLQEEQERELAPEIEEERQVKRPPPKHARDHIFHNDLKHFIFTGQIIPGSRAFQTPFQAMAQSSAAGVFAPGPENFPSDLLITADFAQTVKGFTSDSYQRPVQWVLTSKVEGEALKYGMRMVIISQWEADRMLSRILTAKSPVTLHAYLPRPSVTFQSLEDLKICTFPPVADDWAAPAELIMQLNLFAGQLCLRSYGEYVRLCRYLGLSYTENENEEKISADGFVGTKLFPECEFQTSPVAFLNAVCKRIRRDCMGIEKTHMGRILAGEILTARDFPDEEDKVSHESTTY